MGRVITADVELGVAVVTPQHGLDQRLSHTQPFLETTLTLLVGAPLSSRLHVRGPDPALYLEDLVNGTLTPGVVSGSRVEQVIRRSGNQLYRDVWRRIVGADAAAGAANDSSAPDARPTPSSTSGVVRSLEDGVERVRRDADFVLIVESTDAARVTHQPPGCELTAIDQLLPVARHLFIASAPFETSLRRLDARLTRLREDRVLDELYAKWWQKNECWNRTLVDDVAAAGVGGPDAWSTGGPPAIDAETDGMERIFLESPITWRRRSGRLVDGRTAGDRRRDRRHGADLPRVADHVASADDAGDVRRRRGDVADVRR